MGSLLEIISFWISEEKMKLSLHRRRHCFPSHQDCRCCRLWVRAAAQDFRHHSYYYYVSRESTALARPCLAIVWMWLQADLDAAVRSAVSWLSWRTCTCQIWHRTVWYSQVLFACILVHRIFVIRLCRLMPSTCCHQRQRYTNCAIHHSLVGGQLKFIHQQRRSILLLLTKNNYGRRHYLSP